MSNKETIVAIATALGNAGISIIRISGPKSLKIIKKIFYPKKNDLKTHTVNYGWIKDKGKLIDEVILLVMKAPHSYTREDVVEIHSHGGFFIANKILDILLANGLKLAKSGEFTKRAFLNGRIDLTKAEAINQLISANSSASMDLAINQLQGVLYTKIEEFRKKIAWALALLNAQIDFSEDDIFFTNKTKITKELNNIDLELTKLINNVHKGKMINEGVKVVLLGNTNVGKSSIMNGLAREDRSIVTSTAGTTRDLIETNILIDNIAFCFIDTAGIRNSKSAIELAGIKKSLNAAKKADLILWVIDSVKPNFDLEQYSLLNNTPILMVCNKNDLAILKNKQIPSIYKKLPSINISANSSKDITKLEKLIYQQLFQDYAILKESLLLTNQRQKQAAIQAQLNIQSALKAVEKNYGEEFISLDLSNALQDLGEIVGETSNEELLGNIFAKFCIGK